MERPMPHDQSPSADEWSTYLADGRRHVQRLCTTDPTDVQPAGACRVAFGRRVRRESRPAVLGIAVLRCDVVIPRGARVKRK
jgi:hypothetical protein